MCPPPLALHTMNVISFTAWAARRSKMVLIVGRRRKVRIKKQNWMTTRQLELHLLGHCSLSGYSWALASAARPSSFTPPPELHRRLGLNKTENEEVEWMEERPTEERTLIETIVNCYCVGKVTSKLHPHQPTSSWFAGELMYCYLVGPVYIQSTTSITFPEQLDPTTTTPKSPSSAVLGSSLPGHCVRFCNYKWTTLYELCVANWNHLDRREGRAADSCAAAIYCCEIVFLFVSNFVKEPSGGVDAVVTYEIGTALYLLRWVIS